MVTITASRQNGYETIALNSDFGTKVMLGREAKEFIEECARVFKLGSDGIYFMEYEDLPQKYRITADIVLLI